MSYLVKNKTDRINKLSKEYFSFRDDSTELKMALEEKNKMLLERQDHEIRIATLKERNRIAREIHDNTGHLLSRALLQVGALMTIIKDKDILDNLEALRESLSQGMTNIRASVHDLHEKSIDLYSSIETLVNDFNFCPVNFHFSINNQPSASLKYAFIAIVKEALANIIKHSNATEVSIVLMEHPAMYQLIISDNGDTKKGNFKIDTSSGMGLKNMAERVRGFDGIFNIDNSDGFKIFITIPKTKEVKDDKADSNR